MRGFMRAIEAKRFGGPEVLEVVEQESRALGVGDVRIRVEAAGVNYIDVYHRTGLYPQPLPLHPGLEGAGTVIERGERVTEPEVGARVAWASVQGSYATEVIAPAAKVVAVPSGVNAQVAAAAMLQGMTAHYLTRSTYPLKKGDACLVHAAAGGVGLLLCQLAKDAGARVIGTVSTRDKADLAKSAGADDIILYTDQDFEAEVAKLTGGKKLDVVYDSVGKTTFEKSLGCLRPRGMMVSFGQSSGAIPPFDPLILNAKGSLYLTRPSLAHYTASPEELKARANDLFGAILRGALRISIHQSLPLDEARAAHVLLESRKTSGKLLLVT
jgi:NADPH2:quinone reductase